MGPPITLLSSKLVPPRRFRFVPCDSISFTETNTYAVLGFSMALHAQQLTASALSRATTFPSSKKKCGLKAVRGLSITLLSSKLAPPHRFRLVLCDTSAMIETNTQAVLGSSKALLR